MKYQELYDEYTTLLHYQTEIRRQLQLIPKGYIASKNISGKEYHYLQYTSFGKKYSKYLKETEVARVREELIFRKTLSKELEENRTNLHRLEKAVKMLDEKLSHTFYYLRQCADMDALPISKRNKALSFAKALTSLEGLPARETTEENLKLWAKGEKSFADFYLPALRDYCVMEVPR